MIETPQLPSLLEHELPHFHPNREAISPYRIVEQFVRYTTARIEEEAWSVVSTCLELADRLWQSGTRVVRNAIEAVYVHALSLFLDTHLAMYSRVNSLLPATLHQIWLQEINPERS
ncbi:MAG: hypothetical protein H7Y12_11420 [Sphingobacteriaceae bacterium]|nr:hypothetical protein [Cytophagaceae bacterium]